MNKMNEKKKRYVIAAATVVILVTIIALLLGRGSFTGKITELLDLGNKYLMEQDYEQAVVAFTKAIEIDPMSVEAHIGLVEAYIRNGEFEMALEAAKKGYELTGDERLKEKIDMIESGNIFDCLGRIMKRTGYDENGAVSWRHEFTYNLKGQEASIIVYDRTGKETDRLERAYDEDGRMLNSYGLSDEDGRINLIKYYYQDGFKIKDEYYNNTAGDEVTGYITYEYNENGKTSQSNFYSAGGELNYRHIYEYSEDGRHSKISGYSPSGELTSYQIQTYNENGDCIRNECYSADGTMTTYFIYEYDNSGKQTGTKKYDQDGKLLYEE